MKTDLAFLKLFQLWPTIYSSYCHVYEMLSKILFILKHPANEALFCTINIQ